MRKLMVLAAMLMMVLAAPMALAQNEAPAAAKSPDKAAQKKERTPAKAAAKAPEAADESPAEPKTSPPPDPPPGETATLTFELAVEGEPPAGPRFFGAVPTEGCISTLLMDFDGDDVYTGSVDVPRFPPGPVSTDAEPVSLPVQIVQADGGSSPCDPTRLIEDFGAVPIEGDQTFEASVSFEDGEQPRPGDEVTTTGVLGESEDNCNECAKHAITDETSGTTYYLLSDPQSPFGDYVDLDSYVGQRVTVSGILQMQGLNNLQVTSIEPVGGSGETVEVTFELNLEGDLEERRDFYLDSVPGGEAPDLIFCSSRPEVAGPEVPLCENGATYSETLQVPAEVPFSYQYFTTGDGREVFSAGTEIFDEDATVSATYYADDPTRCTRDFILGCGPDDEVTATYQLTVTGEPPADATFFALGVTNPSLPDDAPLRRLTDPDGDNVYTAEQTTLPGDYHVRIIQGTQTSPCGPFGEACPGEPQSNIEDFGTVAIEDDETFAASVSFGNGPNNSSGGGFLNNTLVAGAATGLLPSTGGALPTLLGTGALLLAGGFLIRKFAQ